MQKAEPHTVLVLPSGEPSQAQVVVRVDLELLARQLVMKAHRSKGKRASLAFGAAEVIILGYPTLARK